MYFFWILNYSSTSLRWVGYWSPSTILWRYRYWNLCITNTTTLWWFNDWSSTTTLWWHKSQNVSITSSNTILCCSAIGSPILTNGCGAGSLPIISTLSRFRLRNLLSNTQLSQIVSQKINGKIEKSFLEMNKGKKVLPRCLKYRLS